MRILKRESNDPNDKDNQIKELKGLLGRIRAV
jgi:hypothetical protein